jgi:hypothetical protein
MNSCRPDSKLEAGLCQALHFFGDFYEILSIYFIARWPRRRSFQNDFVKDMELSFCFIALLTKRVSIPAFRCGLRSRIPLRAPRANRVAHIRRRRDQMRLASRRAAT